jgi:hypothetical protein
VEEEEPVQPAVPARHHSYAPRRAVEKQAVVVEEDNPDELFCVCRTPSHGEMVGCDNDSCPNGEWFHVGCMNLKEGITTSAEWSQQTWYCPECALDRT